MAITWMMMLFTRRKVDNQYKLLIAPEQSKAVPTFPKKADDDAQKDFVVVQEAVPPKPSSTTAWKDDISQTVCDGTPDMKQIFPKNNFYTIYLPHTSSYMHVPQVHKGPPNSYLSWYAYARGVRNPEELRCIRANSAVVVESNRSSSLVKYVTWGVTTVGILAVLVFKAVLLEPQVGSMF